MRTRRRYAARNAQQLLHAGFGAVAAATLSAGVALVAWLALPLPSALTRPDPSPGVAIEDRNGIPLRATRALDGSRARWTPLAEVDPDIIRAFLAVEDRRFYDHSGVDVRAAWRAARDNARAGRVVSGASTLTMQTARLLRPAPRTWAGKVAQALWALRLERHLGKQEILEQYLNRVQLGQGTVGVAAAAQLYFGASAAEVSLGQAALLAGLAHAPSADNPLTAARRATARRQAALRRMAVSGYVTEGDVARAVAEPLLGGDARAPFLAPHFTTRVLRWLEEDGDPSGRRAAEAALRPAVVRTTLDVALQRDVEAEARRTVEDLAERGARQAAAVVLDNRRGEILAWVGSPNFWADTAGQADMVVSARQPGSALKPFVYGLAFDRGYTAASVLADVEHTYQTATGPYHPRNYDHRYHGPVRAREALASSYNVPAVELAERLGAPSVLETLHRAGFASLTRGADYYGLGLALGNGDVTLLELANAYRALARGGEWRPYAWRIAYGARDGAAPEDSTSSGRGGRVMSERAAALVLDILDDRAARIPGFGLDTPFEFPFPAAVKTGTSRHFTDNWAVATTGGFTVAVWVGNFSGRPMEGVSGVSGAGPLLRRVVLATAARYAPGELERPERAGMSAVEICPLSGLLATAECPRAVEWFAPGTAPRRRCDWHRDGEVRLPELFAQWRAQAAVVAETAPGAAPDGGSAPDDPAADRRFRIVSPQDGDRYRVPPGVDRRYATIGLRAAGAGAADVRWYVDGRVTRVARLALAPGAHVIRAELSAHVRSEVRVLVE